MNFTKMHKSHSLLVGLLLLGALACGQSTFDQKLADLYRGTVPVLDSDSVFKLMQSDQAILLDTRSLEEYEVSHLPGAIFYDYESTDPTKLNIPKDQPIVVYCTVGYRSERIGEKLQKLGFSNVSNLYGGILAWKNNDFDVVDAQGPTERVHTYSASWSRWLTKGTKVYE